MSINKKIKNCIVDVLKSRYGDPVLNCIDGLEKGNVAKILECIQSLLPAVIGQKQWVEIQMAELVLDIFVCSEVPIVEVVIDEIEDVFSDIFDSLMYFGIPKETIIKGFKTINKWKT